jgi:putative phage-type endonuclease
MPIHPIFEHALRGFAPPPSAEPLYHCRHCGCGVAAHPFYPEKQESPMSTPAAETPESAFLAERRTGIGGSDLGGILNAEPYGCARRVWYEKRGDVPDYLPANPAALLRGQRLEDLIAEEYSLQTGRKIRRMGVRRHPEQDWALVHADRQILNDSRGPGVLECKSANWRVFAEMKREGLPQAYIAQVQWALYVTGYEWGAFAVLEPSAWELVHFEVQRDEALIAGLVSCARGFWRLVPDGVAPDRLPDPRDRRCATCVFRRTCRGEEMAAVARLPEEDVGPLPEERTPEFEQMAADYVFARDRREEAEELEEAVAARIKETLGERTAVSVPAVGVRFYYRPQVAQRVDTSLLKKKYPEIAAEMTKPSASRPFRFFRVS